MFFELRRSQIQPGERGAWVRAMEDVILPFQISKGMVFVASFIDEGDPDGDVWIRRFESEDERVRLYAGVDESSTWKHDILGTWPPADPRADGRDPPCPHREVAVALTRHELTHAAFAACGAVLAGKGQTPTSLSIKPPQRPMSL